MDRRTLALRSLLTLFPAGLRTGAAQDKASVPPRHDIVVTATRLETPGEKGRKLRDGHHGRRSRPDTQDVRPRGLGDRPRPDDPQERRAGRGVVSLHPGSQQRTHAFPSRRPRAQRPDQPLPLLRPGPSVPQPGRAGRDPPRAPGAPLRLGRARRRRQRHHPGRTRQAPSDPGLVGGHASGRSSRTSGSPGSGRKTDYSLAVFHERTAGLSAASSAYPGNVEKDGYRNLSLAARFGYAPGRAPSLTLTVRAVEARTELDNFGGPGRGRPEQRPGLREPPRPGPVPQPLSERPLGAGPLRLLGWAPGARIEIPSTKPIPRSGRKASTGATCSSSTGRTISSSIRRTRSRPASSSNRKEGRSEYVSESAWGTVESRFPSVRAGSAGVYLLDRWEHRRALLRHGRGPGRPPQPGRVRGDLPRRPGLSHRRDRDEAQGVARHGLQVALPSTSFSLRRLPGGRSATPP